MSEPWLPVSGASAACKVCGERVSMLEAPLHIEDHKQAGEVLEDLLDRRAVEERAHDTRPLG